MRHALTIVLLGSALVACAPRFRTRAEAFASQDEYWNGTKRAAFELDCPQAQLRVVDLGADVVGVEGCGKRAVYKWTEKAGWVNDTGGNEKTPK
jgi:hypothetical protein